MPKSESTHRQPTPQRWLRLAALVLAVVCFGISAPAQAVSNGVISDNYRGLSNVPAGLAGPAYENYNATSLSNLKTFAASPANIQTTETLTDLDFRVNDYGLCNSYNSTGLSKPSCQKGWQGRVMYSMIQFPSSGTYTFTLAHDDDVEINFSDQLSSTNFRTANYNIPIGNLASYTANDTTYETVGTYTATAGSCFLLRAYWNNAGGISHFRLRYGKSGASSGQSIIPASQLLLPGVAENWTSCTNAPASLAVNKISVGDTGSFAFSGSNGFPGETLTTTASGTPASGQSYSLVTLGTATTVTETVPGGYALTGASCVDTNAAKSTNPTTPFGTLSGNTLTIPATNIKAYALLQCTFTNTKLPTLGLGKSSNGPWAVGQSGALYTLTVGNTNAAGGQATSGSITLKDSLPSAVSVPNGSLTPGGTGGANWTCSAASNTVTCTSKSGLSLAAGGSSVLTFPVSVVSGAGSTVTNHASVGGGGDPRNGGAAPTPGAGCAPGGLCASASTAILAPPSIAKAFSPSSVVLNANSTLTLTLTNPNAGTALSNLSFSDGLSGMDVGSAALGGTCVGVTNTPALTVGAVNLNLNVPTLAAGASCTVTVTVRGTAVGVNPNTTSGVSSTQTPTAGSPSNTAYLTVTPSADLAISKTGAAAARPGSDVVYTLTVSNIGTGSAQNAVLSDPLPGGTTFKSATGGGAISGGSVIWSLGTLAAGGTVTVTVTLTMPAEAAVRGDAAADPPIASLLSVTNTAGVVTSSPEINAANNGSSATTALVLSELLKSVRNVTGGGVAGVTASGLPGAVLEYCIVLRNLGGVALADVVIRDDVPGNVGVLGRGYGSPDFGIALTRGGSGAAGSPGLSGGTTTLLTSAATDTDGGSLGSVGGAFGQGQMTVALDSPLAVGESVQSCFQTTIR